MHYHSFIAEKGPGHDRYREFVIFHASDYICPEYLIAYHRENSLWGGAGALEGTHAGGRWGPTARRRRRFFRIFSFFARFFTCFQGIRRSCGHAITPCDSLSALLTVPCCTIDHLHSSRP